MKYYGLTQREGCIFLGEHPALAGAMVEAGKRGITPEWFFSERSLRSFMKQAAALLDDPVRVVVTVEGGSVQAANSDTPGVQVVVKDYDSDTCYGDNVLTDRDGRFSYTWENCALDRAMVGRVFRRVAAASGRAEG